MRISDWSSDVCSSDLLVGFSLGAVVAVQAAADYPERVRSLVPLGGFVSADDTRLQMMLRLWLALIDRDRETLVRQWILAGFSPAFLSSLTPAMLEDAVAQIGRAACRERVWQYV